MWLNFPRSVNEQTYTFCKILLIIPSRRQQEAALVLSIHSWFGPVILDEVQLPPNQDKQNRSLGQGEKRLLVSSNYC